MIEKTWLRDAVFNIAFAGALFTAEIGAVMVIGNIVAKVLNETRENDKGNAAR